MFRVLQVIGKMDRAGAETMIMNLYRNIDKSKIQFDFMVFSEEEGDYDQEIITNGGKIYRMPVFKGYNYFSLYRKFLEFFKEHKYPIVHGHMGSLAPAYLKCAKKAGAYTIAHSHGPNSNVLSERIVYGILSYAVRYVADYFYACSKESGVDRFGKKVVNSSRFKVLSNAIPTEEYRFTKERQDKLKEKFGLTNRVVIGHVGRFVASKNHKFMIEVCEEMCKTCPEVMFVFVGMGKEKNIIEDMVTEKQLHDYVNFMGVRSDIPDMMNLFDGFIFPSIYEGLGIVGIEAQAAGLPCFFSDAIPQEAIVTQNVWQYSLELGAKQWKDNILNVLEQYIRKDAYQEVVKSGFDILQTTKDLEKFYEEHLI